jgi:catechol 2,3-dioxygenase-like lactoylglutathione lyase family enzyme
LSSTVGETSAIARAFHHLDLVVSEFERSLAFYRELLAPLGWRLGGEIVGERGERVQYVNAAAGSSLGLREKQSDAHTTPYDRYAIGVHHIAFDAASRELVDERAGWLRARGADVESWPKEYDYLPGYYAVFFYDPDGIKLEIVFVPE